LCSKGIVVSGQKGPAGAATLHERRELGFVRRSEPVGKFGKSGWILPHSERAPRQRFVLPAASIGFHHNLERLLFETPDMDLSSEPKMRVSTR